MHLHEWERKKLSNILIAYGNGTLYQEQLKTVEYIKSMSSRLGLDPSLLDSDAFYTVNNDGYDVLVTDRGKLNVVIVGLIEQAKQVEASITPELNEALECAERQLKKKFRSQLKMLEDTYQNRLRQYDDHIRCAHDQLKYAFDARLTVQAMEGTLNRHWLVEDIQKVLKANFWVFDCLLEPSSIQFVSKREVFLRQTTGFDLLVKMGRYKARLDIDSMKLYLLKHENNLAVGGGYFHPYLNTGGGICWGDNTNEASALAKNRKIPELMELAASLLSTYNPSSTPYVGLELFQAAYNELHPDEVTRPVEICGDCGRSYDKCRCERCSVCDQHEEDCDCRFCEVCDDKLPAGEMCPDHYCSICEEETEDCGCCHDCGHVADECTCEDEKQEQAEQPQPAQQPDAPVASDTF